MKQILFIFLFIVSISLSAQKHLAFQGIPLNIKLSEFASKMKDAGYKKKYADDNYFSDGFFAGKKAYVGVFSNPQSKVVYSVEVSLDFNSEEQRDQFADDFQKNVEAKYHTVETEGYMDKSTLMNNLELYEPDTKERLGTINIVFKATLPKVCYIIYRDYLNEQAVDKILESYF